VLAVRFWIFDSSCFCSPRRLCSSPLPWQFHSVLLHSFFLNDAKRDFSTGFAPAIGQRLEIQIQTDGMMAGGVESTAAVFVRLSGFVTDVPPLTLASDTQTSATVQHCKCADVHCIVMRSQRVMAAKFGASHGQCVRGVAWLNDSFAHVDAAPIQPDIRYDVELRINHNMKFMWQLVSCVPSDRRSEHWRE
jgi:hypothetical protein